MSSELNRVLEATISPDENLRHEAEKYLESAAQQNLPALLQSLAAVLADVGQSAVSRTAAGLQLKNNLTSKNPETKRQYVIRWLQIDPSVRSSIKELALTTLGTETSQPSSAAQCVAYLAAAELPNQQWGEVTTLLVNNITNVQSSVPLKQATLEAIGYICEETDARFLAPHTNQVLTAIIQGMRKEETSNRVRLAATRALLNALELTRANFENETERHFIMQVLCEATQCEDDEVKVAALQDLVKVMSYFYQYMEAYMGPALFAITLEAMKSENNDVALQGIEFWSTVCDEEQDLAIEAAEAQEAGRPAEHTSKFYIKGALQFLVPILLVLLTKQEEFDDEEDWTPCKAAGVCLMLMANTAEDNIVPHVLPFVQQYMNNPDWKYRDAALYALGAILEGPEPAVLVAQISQIGKIMEVLLDLMINDSSVQVRDTTAWVIGRICEHIPSAVLTDQTILPLLNTLVSSLVAEPRVATNVCWAISSLAEAAYDSVEIPEDAVDDQPQTYCLSQLYSALMSKVLDATQRADGGHNNLRTAAYEALMSLIKHSAKDCYAVICEATNVVLGRLRQAVQLDGQVVSASDKSQLNELQSLLCAALQCLLRKLTKQDALLIADAVMLTLLSMLNTSSGRVSGVQEDALMTAGALIEVINDDFLKYMDGFKPFLLASLKNTAEYQVCHAAVGLVGDLARSLQAHIAPHTAEIMTVLFEDLHDATLHQSVQAVILSTFGDIAIAIGADFKVYFDQVAMILRQASSVQVDKMDYNMVDNLNELRDACLEAYTGILQGLRGPDTRNFSPDVQLLVAHLPFILAFIGSIAIDDDHTDSNVAVAAGLLGDLFTTFGKQVVELLNDKPGVMALLNKGKQSCNQRTKTLSQWALKELKKLT